MKMLGSSLWRLCFILAALFLLTGGPQHPGGTMAEMLGNPKWVPAHSLLLAGFVTLLAGLLLYQRTTSLPARTQRWLRFAVIGTALQAVEMALHTAAVVDHDHLTAGSGTPVLTTHLWLAVVFYPIFALTFIGFIIAGMRDQVLGSPWIAWLGIIGLLAHGAAAPLVVLLKVAGASILFPFLLCFALWLILAGLWPLRVKGGQGIHRERLNEPLRDTGK
ncbi:MAG: hypothetical protein V7641_2896 [Blastocatellia bacterium]